MYPNIIIGNVIFPSWYAMLFMGAAITVAAVIYLRPAGFSFSRKDIFIASILVVLASLFGSRLLFLILHRKANYTLSDFFSYQGGFAYFGGLVLSIITLWVYTAVKKKRLAELLDYGMPFLMLSQVFVRIGCLLAGCCYGKTTNVFWGVTFKPVDNLIRHPTQAYEAILLVIIYIISRSIYFRKKNIYGYTTFFTLMLYGTGRFFIEYLRTDSPVIFLNLTLAQLTCLGLAIVSFLACRVIIKRAAVLAK